MPSAILPDTGLLSGSYGQPSLHRLGRLWRVARAGSVAAAAVVVATVPVRGSLGAFAGLPAWLLAGTRLTALAALVFFSLLLLSARRWLRHLPGPLRYACSFDVFVPAPGWAPPAGTEWLHHDLAGLLVSRHPRLGLRATEAGGRGPAGGRTVRIGGVRLLRRHADGETRVEVRPSVSVGAPSRPGGFARPASVRMAGEDLAPDEHALLVERICASVAEELYRQLEEHASEELAFLPTSYLRARGLWLEAEDHARSNTVSASERARRLYALAAERLDPCQRPLPPTGLRRAGALTATAAAHGSAVVRRVGARAFPRLADRDVVWARCQLGSATALVHRRILSGFPGRHPTAVYEAQPMVRAALSRLELLPAGAPGRDAGLVDGHVALALTLAHLGDRPRARHHLERARAADLRRTDDDAAFLLVAAEVEELGTSRTRLLRRAVALDPRSGTARWRLAVETERRWRSGDHLDPTEAGWVVAEYRNVLALDPGHLGAWASIGHVEWLLGHVQEARETFRTGWLGHALGAGTFVTEFDLGRARAAAESGRFDEAYRHARDATAGLLAQGVPQHPDGEPRSYGAWWFFRSAAVVERSRRYREHVTEHLREARRVGGCSAAMLSAVDAFVWYDHGECLRYAGRPEEAREAFERATEAEPGHVLAHLHLSDLYRRQGDEWRAVGAAGEISRREPSWTTGALARALIDADRAAACGRRSARSLHAAAERESERVRIDRRRLDHGLRGVRPGSAEGALATDRERLEGEIREQRRRGAQHAAQARHAARAVRAAVPAIVPHEWLWRPADGEPQLDWLALNPPDPRRERRWEHQLEEHHAVALHLYGHTWLRYPPEEVREELAYQRAAALLRCVRERFLPRSRAVLVDLLLAEAAVGAPARVTALVADLARGTDEEARQVLAEVLAADDERPDWPAEVLVAACEDDGFSPALSAWMADQAITRLRPRVGAPRGERLAAAARAGFLRGLRSPAVADLLLVGDGMSELCDHDHAAQAYRAVVEAGAGSGGDEDLTRRAAVRLAASDFLSGRWTPAEGGSPSSDGRDALTRAAIADAIGRELTAGARRPCADAASLDAGYEYARLWVAAERETTARARDADAVRDAEAARLALVAARAPSSTAAAVEGVPAGPTVTRLAIETHPDLARDDDRAAGAASSELRALRVAAEDARRDVERRFGVPVPELAWRHDAPDVPPRGYTLVVDGVPVASCHLERDAVFLPARPPGATRSRPRHRPPDWDPWAGAEGGVWAPVGTATDGGERWEPAEFLGRHLASCLQSRLAGFLGIQQVRDALDAWAQAAGGPDPDRRSVADGLRTGAELRTLTVCLRALAAERVPIGDLDPLIDAYRSARAGGASVCGLVRQLRRSVRDRLPGNASGWQRLRLPEDLEADLRRHLAPPDLNGVCLPGPPGADPQDLGPVRDGIGILLGSAADQPVAVVTDPPLRFAVRSLVAVGHPRVPVLALDEVLTAIRLPDDASSPSLVDGGREGELAP